MDVLGAGMNRVVMVHDSLGKRQDFLRAFESQTFNLEQFFKRHKTQEDLEIAIDIYKGLCRENSLLKGHVLQFMEEIAGNPRSKVQVLSNPFLEALSILHDNKNLLIALKKGGQFVPKEVKDEMQKSPRTFQKIFGNREERKISSPQAGEERVATAAPCATASTSVMRAASPKVGFNPFFGYEKLQMPNERVRFLVEVVVRYCEKGKIKKGSEKIIEKAILLAKEIEGDGIGKFGVQLRAYLVEQDSVIEALSALFARVELGEAGSPVMPRAPVASETKKNSPMASGAPDSRLSVKREAPVEGKDSVVPSDFFSIAAAAQKKSEIELRVEKMTIDEIKKLSPKEIEKIFLQICISVDRYAKICFLGKVFFALFDYEKGLVEEKFLKIIKEIAKNFDDDSVGLVMLETTMVARQMYAQKKEEIPLGYTSKVNRYFERVVFLKE